MEFVILLAGGIIYLIYKVLKVWSDDWVLTTKANEQHEKYMAEYNKVLPEIEKSPFLDLAFDCLCKRLDKNIANNFTTTAVYYLGDESFHELVGTQLWLRTGASFSSYSILGYDKIYSAAKRDALVHFLVPRLQEAYPQLNVQNHELKSESSTEGIQNIYQAILVDFSLVNPPAPPIVLKQV